MSVLAAFEIASKDLPIGRLVRDTPGLTLEFERIVPTSDAIMPYFWVTGGDLDQFERNLAAASIVIDFQRLDDVDDGTLYRVEWARHEGMLIEGIVQTSGAVLTGAVDDEFMEFLVRFPDHDHLAQFYNYCTENDITLTLQRVFSLTDRSERSREYGLTAEQREALVLAASSGYFNSPREVTLDELAAELGISQQAVSQRVRRGTQKVMLEALGLSRTEET